MRVKQLHISSGTSMTTLLLLLLSIGLPYATPEGIAYSQSDAPHSKVDPPLLDVLDAAPDGQATFIVYLKEQADLSPAYNIRDWQARGEFVYRTLRETARGLQKGLLAELRQQKSAGAITDHRSFFIVNAIAVAGGRSAVEALATHPDVAYLISDFRFQISDFSPTARSSQYATRNPVTSTGSVQALSEAEGTQYAVRNTVEWNIHQIGADQVWTDFGVTGQGVVIASIDTGVEYTHPALVNQYRGTATGSHDYNWYDPTGTYPTAPGDNHGHGTHVMGIIVGDDGAGNQIGVAPGAQWIAAKGCADWGCAATDLLAAGEWILAPCPIGVAPGGSACDPTKRPHVVNNSWVGGGSAPWLRQMVNAWRAAGIVPVFAAGNSGAGGVGSACNYPGPCVGATDRADVICSSSSQGPTVVAPGCGGIRSAIPGDNYAILNGVASPHAAGVAALVLAANPSLSVEELETLLTSTAVDLGPPGPDRTYGYGRIDAYAAVAQAADPVMMEFDIRTGWQNIVFPALPGLDYDAQRLLEDIAAQSGCPAAVSRWVPELGNWAGYLRGLPFGNFSLQQDRAYFLHATCSSLLRLPANVITDPSECITLTTGWNFVVLPRIAEALLTEAACEQIAAQGGSVIEIDRWDAETGNWAGHVCGLPFGDFEMTPGEGYFIKSEMDSVWCPAPSDE